MSAPFFGQFLLKKGLVSREALQQTLQLQGNKNLKLGQMAQAMGLVSSADIKHAHLSQFNRDIRMGDLLLEMGLLTQHQLDNVLEQQRNTHLYLGEALVLLGILSSEQLRSYLNEFHAEQPAYGSGSPFIPAHLKHQDLVEIAVDMTCKMITRILGVPFRAESCRILTHLVPGFSMASIELHGDIEAQYVMSVSQDIRAKIAQEILGEESVENETEEVLNDSVKEFINVISGNIAAKASHQGKHIRLSLPSITSVPANGYPIPADTTGLCFPIHLGEEGTMDMILLYAESSPTA